jgi:hypothetical protein
MPPAGATGCKGMWAAYMPPEDKDNPGHRPASHRSPLQGPSGHALDPAPQRPVPEHQRRRRMEHDLRDLRLRGRRPSEGMPETPGSPGAEGRVPHPRERRLLRPQDRGRGKTFRRITAGLPPKPCYDLIYRHALDVDEEARALAFGSTPETFGPAEIAVRAGMSSQTTCRRSTVLSSHIKARLILCMNWR